MITVGGVLSIMVIIAVVKLTFPEVSVAIRITVFAPILAAPKVLGVTVSVNEQLSNEPLFTSAGLTVT